MSDRFRFFAPGIPATKGSFRVVPHRYTGAPIVKNELERTKGWQNTIQFGAMRVGPRQPWTGPVEIGLEFVLPMTKTARKEYLQGGDPAPIGKRDDLDKFCRTAFDALTGVIYLDDGQVTRVTAEKTYGDRTGVMVTASRAHPRPRVLSTAHETHSEALAAVLNAMAETGVPGDSVMHQKVSEAIVSRLFAAGIIREVEREPEGEGDAL